MLSCTFFGHKDTKDDIKKMLIKTLIDLIENKNVCIFYVGNQGNYDRIVRSVLRDLLQKYTDIKYSVVLAYRPDNKHSCYDYSETIFPKELNGVFPKYAISKRNEWLIDHSDYVVSYVKYTFGGAYKYTEIARKKGKRVINVAEMYGENE